MDPEALEGNRANQHVIWVRLKIGEPPKMVSFRAVGNDHFCDTTEGLPKD